MFGGVLTCTAIFLAGCQAVVETPAQCMPKPVFTAPILNGCAGNERVHLSIAGDVLLHSGLQKIGYAGGFAALWAQAAPFLQNADIAIANLEGPVAPGIRRSGAQVVDPGPVFGTGVYTGYPTFNYHPMVLESLRALGLDLVTTVNNHALDRGSRGADMTLAELAKAEIGAVGTITAGAPREFVLRRKTRLGTIAFVACSFSTNGRRDPARQVLLCYQDREELLGIVAQQAGDPEVAAVLVLPHWGQEYRSTPDNQQTRLAAELVAAGATAVIGTHPHAVQPFATVTGPQGQVVPVVYSTGNFVATQNFDPAKYGALAVLDMCRSSNGGKMVTDRIGWIAMQMRFTPQAFWLDVAPAGTTGTRAAAFGHLSQVAPGWSAQPSSCEAPIE